MKEKSCRNRWDIHIEERYKRCFCRFNLSICRHLHPPFSLSLSLSLFSHLKTAKDVDYLGHMNNASSLTHAEYARWNWTAQTGMLRRLMKADTHFMVTSAAVRFRRQIRPFGRKFEVQTKLEAIDDDTFWVYQTFRYPELNNDRIRTQVVIKGVATQKGKVISPRLVLEDLMDIPSDVVESMLIENKTVNNAMGEEDVAINDDDNHDDVDGNDDHELYQQSIQSLLTCYQRFDECFRNAAAADDELTGKKSAR